MSNYGVNFWLNISLHIIFLFIILSSFFLAHISKLTKDHFKHIFENLVEESFPNDIGESEETLIKISKIVDLDFLEKSFDKESSVAKINNEWIEKMLIVVNVFMIIMFVGTILLLKNSCNKSVDIKYILGQNIIIFLFVGVIEIFFFSKIAINFVPIPPSYLTKLVVDLLNEKL